MKLPEMAVTLVVGRTIFCAYDVLEKLRLQFPRRKIVPEARLDFGKAVYWNGKGAMRSFSVNDGSLWEAWDFPYFKKIWPRK